LTGTPSDQQKLYNRQIEYFLELLKRYNIQNQYTRLAAVTNGNSVRAIFNFKEGNNYKTVRQFLRDITNPGEQKDTSKATNLILNDIFSVRNGAREPNTPRTVVFVVTKDTDAKLLKKDIEKIEKNDVNVILVVLGDDVAKSTFVNIVPDSNKVVFLEDSKDDKLSKTKDAVDQTIKVVLAGKNLISSCLDLLQCFIANIRDTIRLTIFPLMLP